MNSESTSLQLDIVLAKLEFAPGEELSGEIVWFGGRERTTAQLIMGWYAGNDEQKDLMAHCSGRCELLGRNGKEKFTLTLPRGPLSYAGALFSVCWLIELSTRDRSCHIQVPFTVLTK